MYRQRGPGIGQSFRISLQLLHSFVALGLAWVFWQIASPLNWGYGVAAILGALGGGIHLIKTLFRLAGHIVHDVRLGRLARKTPQAKGDRLAASDRQDELGMR